MKGEISQKEREEVVTKGFLSDYLDSKNYITEDYLDKRLEIYVTKDYLDVRLQEQTTEFKQYMEALMEHHMHQLQVFIEHMDDRYVLRREWNSVRGI